jgi:hypothetical protein
MYYERLPTYCYPLPCGHEIRSLTPSVADDADGKHWFLCRPCGEYFGISPEALIEQPPRHPSGMRMSDAQLQIRTDSAIARDRVARYYFAVWNTVTWLEAADAVGVQLDHVRYVATELGVYGHGG